MAELEEIKLSKQQANTNNSTPSTKRGGLIDISQKHKSNVKDKSSTILSTEPTRPIEHFFDKLKEVFAENVCPFLFINFSILQDIAKQRVADRRRWPPKLMLRVLQDLIAETPRDILAKLKLKSIFVK